MSFAADVQKFSRMASQSLEKTARAVEIQVFAEVINLSPRRTGRFVGNWQISQGAPTDGELAREIEKQQAINEMNEVVAALKGGGVTFMANNLPYAVPLEYGHSKQQAPQGMVRRTVARFNQIADEAAQKNRV